MKEKKAENDALIAFLSNPNAEIKDYLQHNITADNTQLLTKDEYKQTPLIKKKFTDKNGVFNEGDFNIIYDKAAEKYFELGDEEAFKNLLQYNPTSRYKPLGAQALNINFEPVKGNNPNRLAKSISGLNVESDQTKTEEELAQMGKIWDSEKREWRKGTAESQNIFNKVFGTSLIYAQYDHDGYLENPVTGEVAFHRKGEWMKDEDGNYFTMTIPKEDLGNKRVVSLGDILTKEDSAINKLDFFDSDGFNKSIGGVAMKAVTSIFPYLIPGFNTYWGGLTAAVGLASVMPTFYKAMDSMITGGDDQSNTVATLLENWFRKFNPSKSRHGQESFFSFESVGELLADVFGLLHQQTAAASLAKHFYKLPEAKAITSVDDFLKIQRKMSNTGRALALGYMGLISTADVYNDAIQGGYDKRTAGMAALASAGALFGIMNFNESARGLGTWFLKKTTGYDHNVMRSPLIKIAKASYKDAEKAMNEYLTTGNAEAVNKYFGNFWANAKDKMQDIFVSGNVNSWPGMEGVWKSMIVEGVEEVSEEVVQDTVKGITDALSALGYTAKQGSFGGWDNVFSKQGASRYLQTFFGGALGGAVFDLQQNAIDPWIKRTFIDPNYRSERELMAEHDIIDVIFEGRTDELIEEVKNLSKNIFNTKRGATGYLDSNGNFLTVVAEGLNSQADAIASEVINRIRELDTLIRGSLGIKDFKSISVALQEALKLNYGDFYKQAKFIGDLSGKYQGYQQEKFKKYLKNMSDAHKELKAALGLQKELAAETEGQKEKINSDQKLNVQQLLKNFEYWRDKCKSMFNGEESVTTLEDLQLVKMQDDRLADLTVLDFDTWYSLFYKTPFDQLEEGKDDDPIWFDSQKGVKRAYDAYRTSATGDLLTLVDRIPLLRDTYFALLRAVKPEILKWVKSKHKDDYLKSQGFDFGEIFEATVIEGLENQDIDPKVKKEIIEQALSDKIAEYAKVDPRAFTLDERLNIDLASKLESAGIINLDDFNEDQKKIVRALINWNAAVSRFSVFNENTILSIITKTQRQLSDSDNIYRQALINSIEQQKENQEDEEASLIDVSDNAEIADLHFDSTKITKDLLSIKANKIADILGDDDISPELYRMVLNYAAHSIFDTMRNNPIYADTYRNISNAELFTFIKNKLESLNNFLEIDPNILSLSIVEGPENWGIDPSVDIYTLSDEIKKLQEQFGKHKILETNPLRQAIEKIHFALGGSEKSKTLFDWLFDQETKLQASDFTGDTYSLLLQDKTALMDARKTINVLNAAILGTLVGGDPLNPELEIKPLGINSIQVLYLDSYYNGKGREDYLILDTDDFKNVTDYIGELDEKLRTIGQIDEELFKSKSQFYAGLRQQKLEAHKAFIMSGVLKTFKLELPDNQKIVDLLNGFEPNENWSDDLFVQKAKEVIAKNLREEYNKFNSPYSLDEKLSKRREFIKAIIEGVKHISDDINLPASDFFADGILSWKAIQVEDGKITYLNGLYIIKELVKSLYIKPLDELTLLDEIYVKNNPDISPRIDQEEALINLNFMIEHSNAVDDLYTVLYDLLDKVLDPDLIKKTYLKNVAFLLGSGGSGKTLLLTLLAKHKKDKNILVTALAEDKVNDLKQGTGLEGKTLYDLFTNLKDWDNTFKNISAGIAEWAANSKSTLLTDKYLDASLEENIKDGYIKVVSKKDDIVTAEYIREHIKFTFEIDLSNDVLQVYKYDIHEIPKTITFSGSNDLNLLFIDECTQLSPLAQAVITKIALDKNILVFEVGDPLQPTWKYTGIDTSKGKHTKIDVGYDISEYGGFVAGNLAGVWRAENDALQDLISRLYTVYTQSKKIQVEVGSELKTKLISLFDFSRIVDIGSDDYNVHIKPEIELLPVSYRFNNIGSKYSFLGVVHNDDAITSQAIAEAQNVSDASRVVIVPDDSNIDEIRTELASIPKFDASKWQIKKATDILGSEVDYTLIYGFSSGKNGIIDAARDAFMTLTRAKRGAIIHPTSTVFADLGFDKGIVNNNIREYTTEARDAIARREVENISRLLSEATDIPGISNLVTPPISVNTDTDLSEETTLETTSLMSDNKSETEKTPEEKRLERLQLMQLWKKSFGDTDPDMSLLGTWYNRLGIIKDYTTKIWLTKTVKDFIADYKAYDTSYDDFCAFIKIVKLVNDEDSFNGLNIAELFKNLNINFPNIESATIEEVLDAFITFKNYVSNHPSEFARFVTYSEDNDLNWAYLKMNDDPEYVPYLRGGISIISSTGLYFDITCGAFTLYDLGENGESRIVSKTLKEAHDEKKTIRFTKEINQEAYKAYLEGIKTILKTRQVNEHSLFAKGDKIFLPATGIISMLIRNEEKYIRNKDFVGEADLKLKRMSLKAFLEQGQEIVFDLPGDLSKFIDKIDSKTGLITLGTNKKLQKESFKALAQYLRLDNFKTKDNTDPDLQEILRKQEAFFNLYNRNWILTKKKGSDYYLLTMVSLTVKKFRETLSGEYSYSGTHHLLTPFKHWLLIERVCKTVDDKSGTNFVLKLNGLKQKVFNSNAPFKVNKNYVSALQLLLNDLQLKVSEQNSFENIDQLKKLCDSYINAILRSALYAGGRQYSDLTTEELAKSAELQKDIITEKSLEGAIGKLIDEIDNKYENYFYHNTVDDITAESVKVERIYESPQLYWNFDILIRLDEKTGNIVEEKPANTQEFDILTALTEIIRKRFGDSAIITNGPFSQFISTIKTVDDLITNLDNSAYFNDEESTYFGMTINTENTLLEIREIFKNLIIGIKSKNADQAKRLYDAVNNRFRLISFDGEKGLIEDLNLC